MFKKDNYINIYEIVFYDEVNEYLCYFIWFFIFKVYLYLY